MPRLRKGQLCSWFDVRRRKHVIGEITIITPYPCAAPLTPYGGRDYDYLRRVDGLFNQGVERFRILNPLETAQTREDFKTLTIGRLQYQQHFFKSPKYKRKNSWKQGYNQYKALAKKYGFPCNPKRPMPDLF